MNKHVVTNLIVLALVTTAFVMFGWKEGAMWFALLYATTSPWWINSGRCRMLRGGSHVTGDC